MFDLTCLEPEANGKGVHMALSGSGYEAGPTRCSENSRVHVIVNDPEGVG